MSSASDLKAQFYRGTLKRFYQSLHAEKLTPYVMSYDDIISFCKENNISEVVIAGDIMSYHLKNMIFYINALYSMKHALPLL